MGTFAVVGVTIDDMVVMPIVLIVGVVAVLFGLMSTTLFMQVSVIGTRMSWPTRQWAFLWPEYLSFHQMEFELWRESSFDLVV